MNLHRAALVLGLVCAMPATAGAASYGFCDRYLSTADHGSERVEMTFEDRGDRYVEVVILTGYDQAGTRLWRTEGSLACGRGDELCEASFPLVFYTQDAVMDTDAADTPDEVDWDVVTFDHEGRNYFVFAGLNEYLQKVWDEEPSIGLKLDDVAPDVGSYAFNGPGNGFVCVGKTP